MCLHTAIHFEAGSDSGLISRHELRVLLIGFFYPQWILQQSLREIDGYEVSSQFKYYFLCKIQSSIRITLRNTYVGTQCCVFLNTQQPRDGEIQMQGRQVVICRSSSELLCFGVLLRYLDIIKFGRNFWLFFYCLTEVFQL